MGFRNNDRIKLEGGDRITLRNGDVLSYDDYYDKIVNTEDSRTNYNDDLTHKHDRELDIVKVERPTEYETIYKQIEVRTGMKSKNEETIDKLAEVLKEIFA